MMSTAVFSVAIALSASLHDATGHVVYESGTTEQEVIYAGPWYATCLAGCGSQPQTCYSPRYGCYPGNSRLIHRYPAFHGSHYRRPYNYRNLFDYPWHAGMHEPTSLFAYNVEEALPASRSTPQTPKPAVKSPTRNERINRQFPANRALAWQDELAQSAGDGKVDQAYLDYLISEVKRGIQEAENQISPSEQSAKNTTNAENLPRQASVRLESSPSPAFPVVFAAKGSTENPTLETGQASPAAAYSATPVHFQSQPLAKSGPAEQWRPKQR